METPNKKNDIRTVYSKIKEVKSGLGLRSYNGNIKDKDRQLLTKTEDILNRIGTEHKSTLANQIKINPLVAPLILLVNLSGDTIVPKENLESPKKNMVAATKENL